MSFLRANWWLLLAVGGFLGYVEPFSPWVRLLNLFFLWPAIRPLVRRRLTRATEARPQPPLAPVARGKLLLGLRLAASMALLFLWPPSFVRQMQQFIGDRRAAPRASADVTSYRQKVPYSLPFRPAELGEWYVFNGGPDEQTSHSWDLVAQRFAYDFVLADGELRRWTDGTEGRHLTDYLCYAQPILSPADGVVVSVVDGIRDAPRPGTGWLDPFAAHIAGNHVVIQHADGEYSLLAHLIPKSVIVGVGEQVTRGQEVGSCGNSGNSSEPHLHFHVQDRAEFLEAAGLPVAFDEVAVDGGDRSFGVYPERGQRITPSGDRAAGRSG